MSRFGYKVLPPKPRPPEAFIASQELSKEHTPSDPMTPVSRTAGARDISQMTVLERAQYEQEQERLSTLRLADGAARALAAGRNSRPHNTQIAYFTKQQEFKDFCSTLYGQNGDAVTEDKLVTFLQDQVIGRKLRTPGKGKKRKRTADEADDNVAEMAEGETAIDEAEGLANRAVEATASAALVKQYVAAIVDLSKQQKARGQINEWVVVRGNKLTSLLQGSGRDKWKRSRDQMLDRAKGTIIDNYGLSDIIKMSKHCWSQCHGPSHTIKAYLRTVADFLVGHSMLQRGENRRELELADLMPVTLDTEGPTICVILITLINRTKTNKTNMQEFTSAARHRNVHACLLSALAFYLYYCWDCAGEAIPTFAHQSDWYCTKVFTSKAGQPLTYTTHLQWASRVFKEGDTPTLRKTHAGRFGGAQWALLLGAKVDSVARLGLWANDALNKHYLKGIPLDVVRLMAGFDEKGGSYFLPRAAVKPPPSVVEQVWPWVDEWLSWLGHSGEDDRAWPVGQAFRYINVPEENTEGPYYPANRKDVSNDLSTRQFLFLLRHLRTIILQDSVFLMKDFPAHPIFRQRVFQSAAYKEFAAELEIAANREEQNAPEHVRLMQLVPDVARNMQQIQTSLSAELSAGFERQSTNYKALAHQLDMFQRLPTVTYHGADLAKHFQSTLGNPGGQREHSDTNWPIPIDHDHTRDQSPTPQGVNSCTADASTADAAIVPLASAPQAQSATAKAPRTVQSVGGLVYKLPLEANLVPIPYRMSRTNASVSDLWKEWTVGLLGNPAVHDLDRVWGSAWRTTKQQAMWHSRRSNIIRAIKRLANLEDPNEFTEALKIRDPDSGVLGGQPVQKAIDALQKRCTVEKLSLNQLIDVLRKGQ